MVIDYLKCTIDGKPMESFIPGKKPTVQNTSRWLLEEERTRIHYEDLMVLLKEAGFKQ